MEIFKNVRVRSATLLLGVAALTGALGSPVSASAAEVAPAPASQEAGVFDGYVPPECLGGFLPWKNGSYARCESTYAFRASVRCDNGYYYFGSWLNPGQGTSQAYCPPGTLATNWYVEIPD